MVKVTLPVKFWGKLVQFVKLPNSKSCTKFDLQESTLESGEHH